MPDLAQLQRALWTALTAPEGVAAALGSAPGASSPHPSVCGDARASARERLDLYAGMYFQRLLDALAADFPRLAAMLGARDFGALVVAYLAAHPSTHPSLRHLGRALPQFVRTWRTCRPWHADLAALEWARLDVHDRRDEPVLTFERLREAASQGFTQLPLRAIAASARVPFDYDVRPAWRQSDIAAVEAPTREPGTLVVWRRPDRTIHHRLVPGSEASLMAALDHGLEFADLCARLRREYTDDHAARRAIALVGTWTADGLLATPVLR